jgi:hypothetical protein
VWKLAKSVDARFILADEPTFFEKANPDPIEKDCQLGQSPTGTDHRFDLHRRYVWDFHAARVRFLENALAAGPWPNCYDEYLYIDEFHYRAETIGRLVGLLI